MKPLMKPLMPIVQGPFASNCLNDWESYEPTLSAVQALGDDNLAVSKAFKILADAGMIRHDAEAQTCPMCEYTSVDTLSSARLNTILSWDPIREAEQNARVDLERTASALIAFVSRAVTLYDGLLPNPPTESEWEVGLADAGEHVRVSVSVLQAVIKENGDLAAAANNARVLINAGTPSPN